MITLSILDVKQHLANRVKERTKQKKELRFLDLLRKIKKQKGTGGARAGSIKSGTRRGGGRILDHAQETIISS